jgi:aminopeptidase
MAFDFEQATRDLARLAVRFGANVQPGQIVALGLEPGKEALARAIAEEAYAAGAKFVDMTVFDVWLKRARALHADPETLSFIPPWMEQRMEWLSDERAARIAMSGPVAPRALDGIDPELISRDTLPRLPGMMKYINARANNWVGIPGPNPAWAQLVHPRLEPDAAYERLWTEIAHVCRLDEPDPVAAWTERMNELLRVAARLDELHLDRLRYEGPGTDLTIGLLPSSHWIAAEMQTAGGIVHHANLPSEEVFTTPDPQRADGTVTATKPLFTSGTTVTGLRVTFEDGRVTAIDADENAEVLRGLTAHDEGGTRLGEVALVDREGRIGPLGTVFYDTLLDENAASHLALGAGYGMGVADDADQARVNVSDIHIDFMIGSDELDVTGVTEAGDEIPLLRDGSWQI